MSARIFAAGHGEQPRRTFETPRFLVQAWPEHIARSCAAIRQRWDREGAQTPSERNHS